MLSALAFIFNSILLGVGLAMDAFSVSMANGLHEPHMGKGKICAIAGTFGFFQAFMPMTGWVCVHTIIGIFSFFDTLVPWIALGLLGWIGGSMIKEGLAGEDEDDNHVSKLTFGALFMQGIATSIDALSVGFTIADYGWGMALACSLIVAAVTFIISYAGVLIGKRFGTHLSGKATILGGVILVFIGLEIWVSKLFF